MGFEPEWQGRGLSTALLRPVLERCDDEKLPAYLEASSPRNRALPAPRICGDRAVPGRARVAAALADVADPQRVNLSMPEPPAAA